MAHIQAENGMAKITKVKKNRKIAARLPAEKWLRRQLDIIVAARYAAASSRTHD